MQKEKYLIIPNKKELKLYEQYGFNTFILPLENYSIGFDVYFNIDQINEISKQNKVYVMINKFLHKNIHDFNNIIDKFSKDIMFIIEDIGLTQIIDKRRIVIYENHIISNYSAINYLKENGYNNVIINNDLTIREIEEIISKTSSNLYYFYIAKNNIMYSYRNLVHNFNEQFNLKETTSYLITEKVSKEKLYVKDEKDGSVVFYNKIFCASLYKDKLNEINKIINFTLIDSINEKMILENIDNDNLCNLIDSDYYFLENDIKYKVGDIK